MHIQRLKIFAFDTPVHRQAGNGDALFAKLADKSGGKVLRWIGRDEASDALFLITLDDTASHDDTVTSQFLDTHPRASSRGSRHPVENVEVAVASVVDLCAASESTRHRFDLDAIEVVGKSALDRKTFLQNVVV